MRTVPSKFIIGVVAALALLVITSVAGAAAKPNVWLQVRPSPATPLVGATITVTDASGAVVGTGRTSATGSDLLRVRTDGARPYLYTATGGTVDGKPFAGTVLLRSARVGLKGRILHLNAVTTAAVRYVERHGGSVAAAERRILNGIGLDPRHGHLLLKHSTVAVDRRKMNRHHARNGGFDGTVSVFVQALERTRAFPDLSVRRAENPHTRVTTTRVAAGSSTPCTMKTVQAPSSAVNVQVVAAGVQMGAGLLSGFMTKDPSLFLAGAVGMAMSQTPGMTTASMLASIAADLQCISNQIAAVEGTVDATALAVSLLNAQTCQNNIDTYWDQYQTALDDMSSQPPSQTYSKDNPELQQLFDSSRGSVPDDLMSCVGTINSALFNAQGGYTPAWKQALTNYKNGDEFSNDSVAMSQQSNANLQAFLSYWSTYEYEAAVLVNEYYNFQATFYSPMLSFQQNALSPKASSGVVCPAATASVTAVVGSVTNLCQAQQNIVNVWPGDLYTDEVLWYKNTKQASADFGYSGNAISAVPASWGMPSATSTTAPGLITPSYLHDKEIDKYDSRWNAQNAVTFYNAQAATDIGGLNQSIYFRRGTADGTITPYCDGNCGSAFPNLYKYGPFFSSWLSAPVPAAVNGSYATVNLAPGSGTSWQVLAKDGTVVFDDASGGNPTPKCGKNTGHDADGGTYTYYAHYTSHNTIYSPHPWTANSGGTIGGGSDPCAVTVPIAFLKARAVTQGTTWPAAPAIVNQNGSTVGVGVQLSATNCPAGSCTWSISDPAAPSGLTLSPGGVFSWTGAAPGTTASVQIVAGNTQTYSPPVTLTVRA